VVVVHKFAAAETEKDQCLMEILHFICFSVSLTVTSQATGSTIISGPLELLIDTPFEVGCFIIIDQVSISHTFYVKLLRAQIPKVQEDTEDLMVFLCFWDLRALKLCIKAVHKILVKLTTGLENYIFHQYPINITYPKRER